MFSTDSCRSRVTGQSNSWDFGHADHSGSRRLWLFGLQPVSQVLSLPNPPGSTMFSRLSASKAALKSVGTTTRTHTLSSSTVRVQANKPRFAFLSSPFRFPRSGSSRPTPVKQPFRFALLFSSLQSSELSPSAFTRLSYRVGLRQHSHCWFDRLVHPPVWVASICWSGSCQFPR